MWDNFFGNPDNGEDSPKAVTFLLASLLAYSVYEGWLMKLNSPTNSQEVEIITPWSRSDTVGVSARRKETLCYICSHIYSENTDKKQVMALPHARWGNPWLSHRKPHSATSQHANSSSWRNLTQAHQVLVLYIAIVLLTVLCSLSDRVTRRSLGPNHHLEKMLKQHRSSSQLHHRVEKKGILESSDGRAQDSMPLNLGGKGTESLYKKWSFCR